MIKFWMMLFIIWTCVALALVRKLIRLMHIREQRRQPIPQSMEPFHRFDIDKINLLETYLGAIFLLPFRLLIIFFGTLSTLFWLRLLAWHANIWTDLKWIRRRRQLMKQILYLHVRGALFTSGFYWIKQSHRKIAEFDKDYPSERYADRKRIAPIIISNHVSYVDIFFLLQNHNCPAFLASNHVLDYFLFGEGAKLLGCIFLDRSSTVERENVLPQVLERATKVSEGYPCAPIYISPEGTTANGKFLLSFKKGPFTHFQPIKIICLKYAPRNFNPAYDDMPILEHLILLCSQFRSCLEAIEFETFYPDHIVEKGGTWEDYATEVRNLMLSALKIQSSNSGFRDKLELLKRGEPTPKES